MYIRLFPTPARTNMIHPPASPAPGLAAHPTHRQGLLCVAALLTLLVLMPTATTQCPSLLFTGALPQAPMGSFLQCYGAWRKDRNRPPRHSRVSLPGPSLTSEMWQKRPRYSEKMPFKALKCDKPLISLKMAANASAASFARF